MSLRVRGILVIVIGTVLGFIVSIGGQYMGEAAETQHVAVIDYADDPAQVLAEIIARVQEEYVDRIDEDLLVDSAIRGIIEELDGHSRYLDTLAYEDIRISSSGRYAGIGLDVALEDGRPTVVGPIENAPAAQAGIHSGDVVVAVNGEPVTAENFHAMVGRMRGPVGSQVAVDVTRDGAEERLSFLLIRADIEVQTVRGEHLGDGFAYVRISGFSDNTAASLDSVAEVIEAEAGRSLRGMVIDLRNNPGGVLDAAIDVADRFLAEGMIVRGTGRIRHGRFEFHATSGHSLENLPVVILVNAKSASAAEIVAGSLKDHGRARLVGEETYGKGSVQTVMPLTEGRALKITTSRYILPSGRSLAGRGISPDVVVHSDDNRRLYRGATADIRIDEDRQLVHALRAIGFNPLKLSQAL